MHLLQECRYKLQALNKLKWIGISVQQQKYLTLNKMHWLCILQDSMLLVSCHCIILHYLILASTLFIIKLKRGKKAETRKPNITLPTWHWPQQNYYTKNHEQERLSLQTNPTKILGREKQTQCVMVIQYTTYMLIPLKVLRQTCWRSNITYDCHQSQTMQQHISFKHEHWIAKYIPQNKMTYSDHFTPGKIKEINYSNWWRSCHSFYFCHRLFMFCDSLTHFYSLFDVQKGPLALQ